MVHEREGQERAAEALCEVRDLVVAYFTPTPINAINHASFVIDYGEIVGIVGESGSGKSTVAKAMMCLLPDNAAVMNGAILFKKQNMYNLDEESLRRVRWEEIAWVPQSAMNSLNPVLRIGDQIADAIMAHRSDVNRAAAWEQAGQWLRMMDMDPAQSHSYPHELSGGMRQRAVIGMALALHPDLVIMDEPTTALDLVVQAQILRRLKTLQRTLGFSIVFITHDLPLLMSFADRILVMYGGQVVESGPSRDVYDQPLHPYSRGLSQSAPSVFSPGKVQSIPGEPINLANPPTGCRFHPRCPVRIACCDSEEPPVVYTNTSRWATCHLLKEHEQRRSVNNE